MPQSVIHRVAKLFRAGPGQNIHELTLDFDGSNKSPNVFWFEFARLLTPVGLILERRQRVGHQWSLAEAGFPRADSGTTLRRLGI
jgi:hypothetical protein